jgi:RimJ/RimL family protein N-acetyltransferase
MIRPLETERLLLRPLELADAEQAQILFPCWEVVRYLASHVPWPYPEDGALKYYRDVALPAMQRGDEWHWSLRLKSDPVLLIGSIGLMKSENDNRGFWLGVPWQGQGLMTEATAVTMDYWFGELGFAVMRVPKAAANVASRRVSEKDGMRLVGTGEREYVSGRLPSEIWEITAEEWRVRCQSVSPINSRSRQEIRAPFCDESASTQRGAKDL